MLTEEEKNENETEKEVEVENETTNEVELENEAEKEVEAESEVEKEAETEKELDAGSEAEKEMEGGNESEKEAEAEKEVEVVQEIQKLTKWYSLRVISGKERKIKERIEIEGQRSKWDFIEQVLVPSEKVYKIRNGKKVILERNILPGYILIEALPSKLRGEVVMAIANMPNVIHFLGRENPIPMQQSEANRMLGIVDDSQDVGEAMMEPFIVGETVKIIDGPFNEFVGDIQEVNEEKKKLKVIVKIFGRGTEVELNFMQVDKQT